MEIVRDAYIKRNKQDMIPTRLQEAGCTEDRVPGFIVGKPGNRYRILYVVASILSEERKAGLCSQPPACVCVCVFFFLIRFKTFI